MESLVLIPMITGVVEFLRRLQLRDYFAALTIAVAALIGGVLGFFGIEATNVAQGIVLGLAAAGTVTIATRV